MAIIEEDGWRSLSRLCIEYYLVFSAPTTSLVDLLTELSVQSPQFKNTMFSSVWLALWWDFSLCRICLGVSSGLFINRCRDLAFIWDFISSAQCSGCQGTLIVWETAFHMVIYRVYKSSYSRCCIATCVLAGPNKHDCF